MNEQDRVAQDERSAEQQRRVEKKRRIVPGRIESVQWGGFQPPWKHGPITKEPQPRDRRRPSR